MQTPKISQPDSPISIRIIGNRRMQNELLANFLNKEIGCEAFCFVNHDAAALVADTDPNNISITLIDRSAFSPQSPLEQLAPNPAKSDSDRVILWNADRALDESSQAIAMGIRGIFFMDDSLSDLIKGLNAVLRGELWYSREHMCKALRSINKASMPPEAATNVLSRREREILVHLVDGNSNDAIGDKLHISPHTVRTHLCNIYRKIQVTSRVQAMLWSARYL